MSLSQASLSRQCCKAAAIVALVAATASAAIYQANVSVQVDGVDGTGSPSSENGAVVTGKSYKDSNTGIVVQIARAAVINQYGRPRIFSDRGLSVTDPQDTSITHTATNDLEVISRPVSGPVAQAVQVSIYDPAFAPPPPEET